MIKNFIFKFKVLITFTYSDNFCGITQSSFTLNCCFFLVYFHWRGYIEIPWSLQSTHSPIVKPVSVLKVNIHNPFLTLPYWTRSHDISVFNIWFCWIRKCIDFINCFSVLLKRFVCLRLVKIWIHFNDNAQNLIWFFFCKFIP